MDWYIQNDCENRNIFGQQPGLLYVRWVDLKLALSGAILQTDILSGDILYQHQIKHPDGDINSVHVRVYV